jgi:hypothetical protein
MATTRYRVTFNGFTVVSQSWDTALEEDGRGDETWFQSVNKKSRKDGTIIYGGDTSTFVSAVMGDVSSPSTLGRRIKAGSAQRPWWQGGGFEGGLINGDQFPSTAPWTPPLPHELGRDYPPCMTWEDNIADDEVVHIVPAVCEWDTASALGGWLDWQVATDAQFGERAKKVFGPVSGPYSWIFDAVSLGIQTVGTLQGLFQPLGKAGSRPIGITRDPNNPSEGVFNPKVIELTRASADALINANPTGRGPGVLSIPYQDDPYLRGHYVLYLQVHRLGTTPDPSSSQLLTGQRLPRGQRLVSPNGRFTLQMQDDGNLVLYDGTPAVQTALWATHTDNLSDQFRPTHADMQTDGHLVLYNDAMRPAWGTGVFGPTYIHPYLELQDDGNIVIYHNGRQPIWATNTQRP